MFAEMRRINKNRGFQAQCCACRERGKERCNKQILNRHF